jgi:hypothetical protein
MREKTAAIGRFLISETCQRLQFHLGISFASHSCKFFLKSTTGGSKINAAPQLVGGFNIHRKQANRGFFVEN